eukprot:scaffold287753_cov14-Tisochrysis_lutea.AAC.1
MQTALASRGSAFMARTATVQPCRLPVAVSRTPAPLIGCTAAIGCHYGSTVLFSPCYLQPAKVMTVDVEAGMGGKLKTRKVRGQWLWSAVFVCQRSTTSSSSLFPPTTTSAGSLQALEGHRVRKGHGSSRREAALEREDVQEGNPRGWQDVSWGGWCQNG